MLGQDCPDSLISILSSYVYTIDFSVLDSIYYMNSADCTGDCCFILLIFPLNLQ